MPILRLQESLGQFHSTTSKSMARTSRQVMHKIRSILPADQNALNLNLNMDIPPRATTPLKFPRLNETYLLMDVDYLRPTQANRPWAPPHSLQVMNPDPDYLDEEYVQVGPSPAEVDPFNGKAKVHGPTLLSQMNDDEDEDEILPEQQEHELTLCDDIEGCEHVNAALLAGVIRAGLVTQRCRKGL